MVPPLARIIIGRILPENPPLAPPIIGMPIGILGGIGAGTGSGLGLCLGGIGGLVLGGIGGGCISLGSMKSSERLTPGPKPKSSGGGVLIGASLTIGGMSTGACMPLICACKSAICCSNALLSPPNCSACSAKAFC